MKKIIVIISMALLFDGAVSYICYGQTEIGGQYRIMTNASNFDWHQLTVGKNEKSNAYVNQRFRLNINSKFDERALPIILQCPEFICVPAVFTIIAR